MPAWYYYDILDTIAVVIAYGLIAAVIAGVYLLCRFLKWLWNQL